MIGIANYVYPKPATAEMKGLLVVCLASGQPSCIPSRSWSSTTEGLNVSIKHILVDSLDTTMIPMEIDT